MCACGRLGFGTANVPDGGDDADIDAFEILREDGGFDPVCATPQTPTSLALGRHHACAIALNNLYCWGTNADGQLGLADNTRRTTPTQVSMTNWANVAAGG